MRFEEYWFLESLRQRTELGESWHIGETATKKDFEILYGVTFLARKVEKHEERHH